MIDGQKSTSYFIMFYPTLRDVKKKKKKKKKKQAQDRHLYEEVLNKAKSLRILLIDFKKKNNLKMLKQNFRDVKSSKLAFVI